MNHPRPILVIEPDHDSRDGFCEYLELSGERVVCVQDELEALEVLRSGELPSVVLLDLPLTRLADNPLLQTLEQVDALAGVPVVLLTSTPSRRHRLEPGGLRNVRRILIKPVDLDVLLEALRAAMGAGSAATVTADAH